MKHSHHPIVSVAITAIEHLQGVGYGFSNSMAYYRRALAIYVVWYNFCRPHESIGWLTPAEYLGLDAMSPEDVLRLV